jgi:polygalacturonase
VIDRRRLLLYGSAVALLATAPAFARKTADPWTKARQIVRGIQRPRIGRRKLRLGSPANGDIRAAIMAAMDQLGSKGGTITLPKGDWLSNGPIHFKSRIALDIPEGTHLKFSREPEHYLPMVFTRWEGTECWNYSPLIYAHDVTDIAITGKGAIDGQGFEGFFKWRPQQRESQQLLRKMGAEGVPMDQRRFGPGHYLRPGFVQFINCQRVLIDGPHLTDSTFWMIHPIYCDHVTVRNISLKSDHLNSDGVDPDSSTNVLIERCIFDVGDDGVAIKSGRDQDGWRVARPSSRIVVRDCEYRGTAGGGFSIGSEISGGVHDVFVERYRMGSVSHGLYFKSNLDRGGAIRDIHIRDIDIGKAQGALIFTTDYHGYRGGQHPQYFSDINVENVRCGEAIVGMSLIGTEKAPLERVSVRNLTIAKAKTPMRVKHVRELRFDNVSANGLPLSAIAETAPETFADKIKL